MKPNRAHAFEIVFKGIALKAPLWALLMLIIFGCIARCMIWFIGYVIEPSIKSAETATNKSSPFNIKDDLAVSDFQLKSSSEESSLKTEK